jgi:VanZ family protein
MTTTASPKISYKAATFWLLALLWTGLILWAGSDSYSLAKTSRILLPIVRWLLPNADFQTHWDVILAVRKAAHLIEYAVLAWLTWFALFSTYRRALLRYVGLAFVWVVVVATLDEIRQGLIDSRTGSIVDIAIDLAGGILALALAIAYTRFMRRERGSVANE